jgi:hypothetical protein
LSSAGESTRPDADFFRASPASFASISPADGAACAGRSIAGGSGRRLRVAPGGQRHGRVHQVLGRLVLVAGETGGGIDRLDRGGGRGLGERGRGGVDAEGRRKTEAEARHDGDSAVDARGQAADGADLAVPGARIADIAGRDDVHRERGERRQGVY